MAYNFSHSDLRETFSWIHSWKYLRSFDLIDEVINALYLEFNNDSAFFPMIYSQQLDAKKHPFLWKLWRYVTRKFLFKKISFTKLFEIVSLFFYIKLYEILFLSSDRVLFQWNFVLNTRSITFWNVHLSFIGQFCYLITKIEYCIYSALLAISSSWSNSFQFTFIQILDRV